MMVQVCDALTVSCVVDCVEGSISDVDVTCSRVRVSHKLTYDAADVIMAYVAGADLSASSEGLQLPPESNEPGVQVDLKALAEIGRARWV
jgi:exoribonuclease R